MNSIQQAAERLRQFYRGDDFPREYRDFDRDADRKLIIDAYLAEHDPTPLDERWLRSVGFDGGEIRMPLKKDGTLYVNDCGDAEIELPCDSRKRDKHIVTMGDVRTRGDVRRLAAALGITLKEPANGEA